MKKNKERNNLIRVSRKIISKGLGLTNSSTRTVLLNHVAKLILARYHYQAEFVSSAIPYGFFFLFQKFKLLPVDCQARPIKECSTGKNRCNPVFKATEF